MFNLNEIFFIFKLNMKFAINNIYEKNVKNIILN